MRLLAFFGEFTFETLLAILSCLLGIVALFVGGKALHYTNKVRISEKKKIGKNGKDESRTAGGDIINNNYFGCLGKDCPKFSEDPTDNENIEKAS